MKRGSIDLARLLCVEVAGFTDEEEDANGHDYGSVDIAEILSAEVVRLRAENERLIRLFWHIRDFEIGRDEDGDLGSKAPFSLETVALVAFDCASASLTPNVGVQPPAGGGSAGTKC